MREFLCDNSRLSHTECIFQGTKSDVIPLGSTIMVLVKVLGSALVSKLEDTFLSSRSR